MGKRTPIDADKPMQSTTVCEDNDGNLTLSDDLNDCNFEIGDRVVVITEGEFLRLKRMEKDVLG